MIEEAVRGALRRIGTRGGVLDSCPVCGDPVTPASDSVRAWRGKLAHRGCAHYARRRERGVRSRAVHTPFTRT